jgi:hypothetical protein
VRSDRVIAKGSTLLPSMTNGAFVLDSVMAMHMMSNFVITTDKR